MRFFISYHTPDRPVAMALQQGIKTALPESDIFLDQSHLRFGYNWQPALYEAIETSDAVLALIGNRLGNWQTAEYYAAHDRKVRNPSTFVLLPIIIADRKRGPVPNLPGLSQLHWIECTEPTSPDIMSSIIGALSGKPLPESPKPWMLVNPYRGLMALEEQDSDFFFGRERETEQTIGSIVAQPQKIVALVGNSGVGKSSLVQAGVIAALKRQKMPSGSSWPEALAGSREWAFLTFRPSDEPVKALVSAFVNLWFPDATDPAKYKRISEWTDHLTNQGNLAELYQATQQRFSDQGLVPPQRAFVYVDQGEELYDRGSDLGTLRLSHLLAEASRSDAFVLMLSQRSDFYGQFQANRELFDRSVVVDLAPLMPADLTRVLREPAARLGVEFYPPALPEQLVDASSGQPGALALLADLMIDVWEKMQRRGKDGVIRALEDAQLIDVEKSLSTRADRFLAAHHEEQAIIEKLFVLRLVKIYEQGNPYRRRVYEKDCSPAEWSVLHALSSPEWRLVVTGIEDGEAFAEVAHDILLAKWPALSAWITREREFLLWRTDTDREFNRWLRNWLSTDSIPADDAARRAFNIAVFNHPEIGGGNRELLRGSRLDTATEHLATRADAIEQHLRLFIERSSQMAQNEAETNNLSSSVTGGGSDSQIKLTVFICYARQDLALTDELSEELASRGIDVIVDRQGIAAGEDWRSRLGSVIAEADVFLFLMSRSSLQSSVCQWEIEQADRLSKHVIPFVIDEQIEPSQVPERLANLNQIKLAPHGGKYVFQEAVSRLAEHLRADVDWLRESTRLMARATEWEAVGRPSNRLLSGPDIALAKTWAANKPGQMPKVATLVMDFIRSSEAAGDEQAQVLQAALAASRDGDHIRSVLDAQIRRQRAIITALLALLLVVSVIAGRLYFLQL